jgi:hypothetical protein
VSFFNYRALLHVPFPGADTAAATSQFQQQKAIGKRDESERGFSGREISAWWMMARHRPVQRLLRVRLLGLDLAEMI